MKVKALGAPQAEQLLSVEEGDAALEASLEAELAAAAAAGDTESLQGLSTAHGAPDAAQDNGEEARSPYDASYQHPEPEASGGGSGISGDRAADDGDVGGVKLEACPSEPHGGNQQETTAAVDHGAVVSELGIPVKSELEDARDPDSVQGAGIGAGLPAVGVSSQAASGIREVGDANLNMSGADPLAEAEILKEGDENVDQRGQKRGLKEQAGSASADSFGRSVKVKVEL